MSSRYEARMLASSLRPFDVRSGIGTSEFVRMYCVAVEKLAMVAHGQASSSFSLLSSSSSSSEEEEEYVVEELIAEGKVGTLVRTLVALEGWRSDVLRLGGEKEDSAGDGTGDSTGDSSEASLASLIASNSNVLRASFVMHAETTIVGLLNLVLYRRVGAVELGHHDHDHDHDHDHGDENDTAGGTEAMRRPKGGRGGCTAIALVDYCARRIAALSIPINNSPMLRKQKDPSSSLSTSLPSYSCHSATELSKLLLQSRTPFDELVDATLESEYKTSVSSVATARYLCEHFDVLPLGVQSRILNTHDLPILLVNLIEEPPWTRRVWRRKLIKTRTMDSKDTAFSGCGGTSTSVSASVSGSVSGSDKHDELQLVWEKFIDNTWNVVPPTDLLVVTKHEAQPWLALYHLLCTNSCRERYGLDSYRKSRLLRLRKYINDVLIDQIPVLADVARYLDELAVLSVPDASVAPKSRSGTMSSLLLEQVDVLREEVMHLPKGKTWHDVAMEQYRNVWSKVTDKSDADLRMISEVHCGPLPDHTLDASCLMTEEGEGGRKPAAVEEEEEEEEEEALKNLSNDRQLSRPLECVKLTVYAPSSPPPPPPTLQRVEASPSSSSSSSSYSDRHYVAIASLTLHPPSSYNVNGGDSSTGQTAVPTQYGLYVRIKMRIQRDTDVNEKDKRGEEERFLPIPILPNSRIVATASFRNGNGDGCNSSSRNRPPSVHGKKVVCEDLDLPTIVSKKKKKKQENDAQDNENDNDDNNDEGKEECNEEQQQQKQKEEGEEIGLEVPRTFPSRIWRQLGLLEEDRWVLQLGFKRLDRTVRAATAVVSRPTSRAVDEKGGGAKDDDVESGIGDGDDYGGGGGGGVCCYGLDRAFVSKPVDAYP